MVYVSRPTIARVMQATMALGAICTSAMALCARCRQHAVDTAPVWDTTIVRAFTKIIRVSFAINSIATVFRDSMLACALHTAFACLMTIARVMLDMMGHNATLGRAFPFTGAIPRTCAHRTAHVTRSTRVNAMQDMVEHSATCTLALASIMQTIPLVQRTDRALHATRATARRRCIRELLAMFGTVMV